MRNKDKNISKKGNAFDWVVIKRLFGFLKPYKARFYLLCCSILAVSVLAPMSAIFTSKAINGPIKNADNDGLLLIALLMLSVLIFQSLLQFINTYLSSWIGQNIIRDLRVRLFKHVASFPVSYFDKTPVGRLVTRNVSDIETISDVFSQGIAAMLADVLTLFFILGSMFWLNFRLTLISLVTIPFLLYATYLFKEKIKTSFDSVRTAVSNLNTYVNERLTGIAIVQLFNQEKEVYKQFQEVNKEHRKAQLNTVKYYSIYFPIAELISALAIGVLVWYAGNETLKGNLDKTGDIVAFIMLLGMFFRPLRMIADRFNQLQLGIVSTSRIINLLDEELQEEDVLAGTTFNNGNVKFKNVDFSYKQGEQVLSDISFEVGEGEMLAIVGSTGSGKSTLINLLNRFYSKNSGEIKIDDKPIESYALSKVRSSIGVVQQDVFLFSGTLYENIVLNDLSITHQKIIELIKVIGAESLIDNLANGLDTKIQERGANLSVGERQLVSFVRVLAHDPKIIILDEATSSIDSKAEKLIQGAIDKLLEGRTSIVIAHRLSTIKKANSIIVLDKGKIIEKGTHEDLLKTGGVYTQLNQDQEKILSIKNED